MSSNRREGERWMGDVVKCGVNDKEPLDMLDMADILRR